MALLLSWAASHIVSSASVIITLFIVGPKGLEEAALKCECLRVPRPTVYPILIYIPGASMIHEAVATDDSLHHFVCMATRWCNPTPPSPPSPLDTLCWFLCCDARLHRCVLLCTCILDVSLQRWTPHHTEQMLISKGSQCISVDTLVSKRLTMVFLCMSSRIRARAEKKKMWWLNAEAAGDSIWNRWRCNQSEAEMIIWNKIANQQ